MYGFDHSRFQRLDDFGAVVGDDLADGGGHHIDAAKDSPQQRDEGEEHDQPERDARRRMHRRIAQGERGGHELGFVGVQVGAVGLFALRPGVTKDSGIALGQI